MTEGTIANWKVKEGEAFSAGDVLLEIETDKATMDVEAQDDGVMMRIVAGQGSKEVQVGSRIAVIAEPGDDISSLEVPADEAPKSAKPSEPKAAAEEPKAPAPEQKRGGASGSGEQREVRYPLLPSVQSLVSQHGLEAEVSKITPTGPGGRLLKGDVLAYVGAISASAPAAVSSLFDRLSHLDLSNIKVAPPKEPAPAAKPAPAAPEAPAPPRTAEVSLPVSFGRVVETQQRIHESLGTFLPLSTFISRAADAANDELPRAARAPTSNELFDAVLGIEVPSAGTRGAYAPRIAAVRGVPPAGPAPKADIIDILAGTAKKSAPRAPSAVPGLSTGTNIFSLEVPKAEEKRAGVFLERVKAILENEPGRLVL